jgi:hypothetical protein
MQARAARLSSAQYWQLLPRVGLLMLAAMAAVQMSMPLLVLRGQVLDVQTGLPLSGVVARTASEMTQTGPNGAFELSLPAPWEMISFEADGYEPRSTIGWSPEVLSLRLLPRTAEVWVRDRDTGAPLLAALRSDFGQVQALEPGRFRLSPVRTGSQLTASADGFRSETAAYTGESSIELRLRPIRVGRVLNAADGQPIAGASIAADEEIATSRADGSFELSARPSQPLRVIAPGYRRFTVAAAPAPSLELHLEPFVARGLYLTYYGVGSGELRANALRLLETTEANTIVVDVKGDRGYVAYPSRVPLVSQIGAHESQTLPDVDQFLADLHARGHYAIARIVVFKDDLLARNGPAAGLDVAVKDRRSGSFWVDGEGLGWVDPFRSDVWEYNIALAREAAERGFDEIQFDYIRFPTDPSTSTSVDATVYSRESTDLSRTTAIANFLEASRRALRPLGAFLSIDTFGYTCWQEDDMGIGQDLLVIAPHVDYLSPMVYPSTFTAGLPNSIDYPAVVSRPYDVVYTSLERAGRRVVGSGALIRPWLQYFDDYPWATGRPYNASEVRDQKKAAVDAGTLGWMLWDPSNRYARGGLEPR